jgi:general secretion pathway protein G
MKSRQAYAGFTLIEVLVVLVILGLLAGLVGPRLFGKVDESKVKTAETQIRMLKTTLQTFRLDVGRYPSTEEGLAALEKRPAGDSVPTWDGPYLDEALPVDPWGNAFQYRAEPSGTQEFTLYSFGADGKSGGEGKDADIGYMP